MAKFHQGRFTPQNPSKYVGDPTKIVFRSSWERKFMGFLDTHSSVLRWESECTIIPYVKPTDNKVHRYFMDFVVEMIDKDGNVSINAIEIKPFKETQPPIKKTRVTKRYLNECATYAINQAKWKAAKEYCKKKGWNFRIFTEYELGISKKKS